MDIECGNLWFKLSNLHRNLCNGDLNEQDVSNSVLLQELQEKVDNIKLKCSNFWTGKLWLLFMNFVSIIRLFIRAERTGNWQLYLKCTQDMLPYFAAAGHNNYTKCCRLFLQDAQNLCSCMATSLEEGLFTVRRNKSLYWSGTWSDMAIEQCLMRAAKTSGGLINITHREAARTVWLLSAHVLLQYTDGLRAMTGCFAGSWS